MDNQANADRNRLVHSIGNLTLVQGRLNARLSNSPWEEKRRTLDDHSVLFLNRNLLKDATCQWNESAIEDRSRTLHRTAVAQKNQDLTLATWTTTIAADDVLEFEVDSVATVQRVTVAIRGRKT